MGKRKDLNKRGNWDFQCSAEESKKLQANLLWPQTNSNSGYLGREKKKKKKNRRMIKYFREMFPSYTFWTQHVPAEPLAPQAKEIKLPPTQTQVQYGATINYTDWKNGMENVSIHRALSCSLQSEGHFPLDSWWNHIPTLYMNDGFWWNHTEIINKPVSGYQTVRTLISIIRKRASEKSQKPPSKQDLCSSDEWWLTSFFTFHAFFFFTF